MDDTDHFDELISSLQLDLSPIKSRLIDREDVYDVDCGLKPGDHIAVPFGSLSPNSPWHHGIYVGDRKVIDFSGPSKEDGAIATRSMKEFMGRASFVVVVDYDVDTEESRRISIQRATLCMKSGTKVVYNALLFNCEHFATFCKTSRYDVTFDIDIPVKQPGLRKPV